MPKDPFDDTEEEKKPKASDEDEEEGKEVSTEPDENDDEEPAKAGESEESRAEKKRNRYREVREEAKREKERADSLERQANEERTARIAAQTAAEMYARQQQAPPQQQVDPWAESEKYVKDKFQFIISETQRLKGENRLDEESTRRLQSEWIDNQQRQQELVTRKLMWQQNMLQRQQAPEWENQQRLAAVEARLVAEYPEVMNHQQAKAHASAGWQMAIAAGKPNSWDTAREVMATTMRAFRLGRPPPVDEATKRRYSGVGGGSNGAAGHAPGKFRMSKAHEKMAEGRYPNLPPDKAHQKWAQTIGKKILEDDA
jgi:hypothetical protein